MLHVLSLGVGVQSTTMALMAAHGEITPMPDAAIFGDTEWEPAAVYEHLRWLSSPNVLPYPVIVASKGDLGEDSLVVRRSKRSGKLYHKGNIPAFTIAKNGKKGILPRHCTRDYKINVVQREVRRLLGVRRFRKNTGPVVEMWIGISVDEAIRKKPSAVPWAVNRHPLLEMGMTRADCLRWMETHGYPRPPRSACVFCPYHSDDEWIRLKTEAPQEFARAVEFERRFQAANAQAETTRSVPYLHDSRVPLDEVEFTPGAKSFDKFGNECEGMCGV